MSEVYDNWEKLVEAIFKNEERRQLALCSSFSSYTSDDLSSCPSLIDYPIVDITSGPSNPLEPLHGDGKIGVAMSAARLFAAPAILRTLFSKTKPEFHDPSKPRRFSFRELLIATDNFNNKNLLGRGGFGNVYRGRLKDGSLVAVKRCRSVPNQQIDLQFQTEVEIMSKVMHRNLLRLHGFCVTRKERVLVYALMVNGSVASYLRKRPHLDWSTRKRIAVGSARGLEFLHHCNRKVIHCNVTSSNIFLDVDFEAVVGDFGLALLMDRNDTHVITSALFGTSAHMPPEYLSIGQVSEKTDVFGYGVMLLELVTGQIAFSLDRFANGDGDYLVLLHWVWKLVKENKLERLIEGNYIKAEVDPVIQLALICTDRSPEKRPEMREVVEMLEGDGRLAERWEELRDSLDSERLHNDAISKRLEKLQNRKMSRRWLMYEQKILDSDVQPEELQ